MGTHFWQEIRQKAALAPKRIILADGGDERAILAARSAEREKIAIPILVRPEALSEDHREKFLSLLLSLPKYKTLTTAQALEKLKDPLIVGCLYVKSGLADGFVGGATRTTGDTLRAAFSIIGLSPRTSTLFGFFLIERRDPGKAEDDIVLLGDCAVIPDPSVKQMAQIGIGGAEAFRFFTGQEARVAFLSFSTLGSAEHEKVAFVRQALAIARSKAPEVVMEGEWQADAALDAFSARMKGAEASSMAGRANVLVVPDLNTGNIAYKLVQRLGGCRAVGPILWGMAAPANDLSRGCSSEDILDLIALTSIQAQVPKVVIPASRRPGSSVLIADTGPRLTIRRDDASQKGSL